MILMRYPNGLAKALTLSYDDGVAQDIRLIEIMSKHGLKGTFNINSGLFAKEDNLTGKDRLSAKQLHELYTSSGNEVAVHGFTHTHLEDVSPEHATLEVLKDRSNLEELFGTTIRGMAYPYGTYSDDVVNCLKACGIAYSRTVISSGWFDIPQDWLRLPATCHHNDPRLFELVDKFLTIEKRPNCDVPWLFYLWGHSYEFDWNNGWEIIEKFAEKMGNRDDIWYATNIEIYDYVHAYKQLRFNLAQTSCYNPTATDLWFMKDSKLYEVKAGETISL